MTVMNAWFGKVKGFSFIAHALFALPASAPNWLLETLIKKSQTRKKTASRNRGEHFKNQVTVWPVALQLSWKKTQVALVISQHTLPTAPM